MKKLVKENMLKEKINEGFQADLNKWMEENDINIDDKDQTENVYALCKKVYDLEKELHKRTPLKGVDRF